MSEQDNGQSNGHNRLRSFRNTPFQRQASGEWVEGRTFENTLKSTQHFVQRLRSNINTEHFTKFGGELGFMASAAAMTVANPNAKIEDHPLIMVMVLGGSLFGAGIGRITGSIANKIEASSKQK